MKNLNFPIKVFVLFSAGVYLSVVAAALHDYLFVKFPETVTIDISAPTVWLVIAIAMLLFFVAGIGRNR